MRRFSAQLAHPSGLVGRGVARLLNRANHGPVTGTVAALDEIEGKVVADVGFGGGLGLQLLLDRVGEVGTVIGIDNSPTVIAAARSRFRRQIDSGQLRIQQASMETLPFADKSIDGVITANTIYYIADIEASLREVARVLRPTGRLVLGLGDPDYMATLPFAGPGVRLRPVPEVVDLLRAAGLELSDHRRVGESHRAFHVLIAEPASAS